MRTIVQLPKEILNPLNIDYKFEYRRYGIEVLEEEDGLYCSAQLPQGWSKEKTLDGNFALFDEKNRKRAFIYKYDDTYAHVKFLTRFRVDCLPVNPVNKGESIIEYRGLVLDCDGSIIYSTFSQEIDLNQKSYYDSIDSLKDIAKVWMQFHLPNYTSTVAYWDSAPAC